MKKALIILGIIIGIVIIGAIVLFVLYKQVTKIETTPAVSALRINTIINKGKIDSINKYVKNYPNNTQLSFAFIDGDSVTYYGVIRENDTLQSIQNEDSIFQIGSISKVFTSTLLADFVLKNKIDLEAPIQKYFDFSLKSIQKDGKSITLKTLSNHTSGLPRLPSGMTMSSIMNPDDPYKDYTQEKLNTYLREKMSLKNTPGTKMAYSNLGVGLIGDILTNVSGKSYEELLQDKIFKPYNMDSSSSERDALTTIPVSGLSPSGKKVPSWTFTTMKGAGAIYSTVKDLSKFAKKNFQTDEVLDFQKTKTFEISEKQSIALGWFIVTNKEGNEFYFHNGATGGYMSSMALDVKNQKAVIILSNVNFLHPDSKNLDKLCLKLITL